jgi:hypothetical protein
METSGSTETRRTAMLAGFAPVATSIYGRIGE